MEEEADLEIPDNSSLEINNSDKKVTFSEDFPEDVDKREENDDNKITTVNENNIEEIDIENGGNTSIESEKKEDINELDNILKSDGIDIGFTQVDNKSVTPET